jgi:hypothetical protein
MSVFGVNSKAMGPAAVARTPNFVGAAHSDQLARQQQQNRRDKQKQNMITGGAALANSLRGSGMFGQQDPTPAPMGQPAGADAGTSSKLDAGPNPGPFVKGASTPGAGMVRGGGGLPGAPGKSGPGKPPVVSQLNEQAGIGGAGDMASNPTGWAAMAALTAYSLLG